MIWSRSTLSTAQWDYLWPFPSDRLSNFVHQLMSNTKTIWTLGARSISALYILCRKLLSPIQALSTCESHSKCSLPLIAILVIWFGKAALSFACRWDNTWIYWICPALEQLAKILRWLWDTRWHCWHSLYCMFACTTVETESWSIRTTKTLGNRIIKRDEVNAIARTTTLQGLVMG